MARHPFAALMLSAVTALVACGRSTTPPVAASNVPFAVPLQDDAGLVNISEDLAAVLEHGGLPGSCEAWEADPENRRKRLLCGKYLFFYGTFDTLGAPQAFVDYLLRWFPDQIGAAFSLRGMIPDPYSAEGYPIGMTPTRPINGVVPALAFTCASCHFGQLPDGRYAAGYGNHRYDYGRQILELVTFPVAALKGPARHNGSHHPDALAIVQPLLDRYDADLLMQIDLARVVATVLPFALNFKLPSAEDEGLYARMKPGVQDFFLPPTAYDDGVQSLHRIHALWNMPDNAGWRAAGMVHGMLGWAGSVHTMEEFAEQFVLLGGGIPENWPRSRLQPLADYIYTLAAPANPQPPPAAAVARGRRLFTDSGCLDCHGGPAGSGLRLFDFDEIGTEDALRFWADGADGDGRPCCGIEETAEFQITNRVKSPRLTGLWAMLRFLHNGSVESLEDLLCLDVERPMILEPVVSDAGHLFGCALADDEKRDLIAFLRSL